MPGKAKPQAELTRLASLAADPAAQARYALELLDTPSSGPVVEAALRALGHPPPAARPVLLRRYAQYAADGPARDPGAYLRVALLAALEPLTRMDDIPLLEQAVATYEFLPPGKREEAGRLRGTALQLLAPLDPDLAALYAVRLLGDPHTSPMSGEPAVTAVRVLGDAGQALPLYAYVLGAAAPVADVLSECLRRLTALPPPLLRDLVARYGPSEDGIVLAGLCDLILAHPAGAAHNDLVAEFLRSTRFPDVYQYLVTTIVAEHRATWLPALLAAAAAERHPRKLASLVAALALVRNDPAVTALRAELAARLPSR